MIAPEKPLPHNSQKNKGSFLPKPLSPYEKMEASSNVLSFKDFEDTTMYKDICAEQPKFPAKPHLPNPYEYPEEDILFLYTAATAYKKHRIVIRGAKWVK